MATLFFFLILSLSLYTSPSSSQLEEFTYTGFHHPKPNLTLNDAALIRKSGVLQLTNETSRLKGHAFYPSPIQFKNSTTKTVSSFSTCFAFSIHPEYPKLGGHGFAFTFAPDDQLSSSLPSQYLGLVNSSDAGNFSNHIFAVEFYTVQDFEFGDINDNHIDIDVNSLASNASASAAYFTSDSVKHDLNLKG
ncbi:hypothetical protein SASPL_102026 [Salvia splendens]|uniref:Legume lectin domain-containing protein n=1 Tax=Salvia splendens TaxID=180675 RepID=A0A8X8YVL5_SALSN|nr:L-type lectin-domain containing receptor kinase S.4-like [Salvia splendens]KAG6437116.1 hypothetical protein SASPL_102026 [Salvia splendens]